MPGSDSPIRDMPLITMMFTDVVESTATKRDISFGRDNRERDHAYLTKVQTPHFELIRACCLAHSGREVSTIGDAFFLAFDDPAEAVRCAVHIQKRLNETPIETPLGPLRVRIGIHSGFPEFFESSWHGTDVDTAARVEAAAEARQIVVSARAYELTCDMTDAKFYPLGEFKLKGVGQVALWEVDWQGKGPSPPSAPAPEVVRRQKQIKIAVASGLAIAILAAGGAAYRYKVMHRPVVPTPFGVPTSGRRSVAVFAFENLGKPEVEWLSTALPELLNTDLTASGELRAISGEDMWTTKTDLDLKKTSSYSNATLTKIRKILHTDYVVAGAYVAAGNLPTDAITLDLNLQDAATGQLLGSFKQEGTVGAYSDLLKRAGADLKNRLRVKDPPQPQLDTAKASSPTNPEALRYYAEGLAKLRTFDALEATDLLGRALAIEPNLAVAHSALAKAWQILGYDSKALEEAKKAVDNDGSLSPDDQSAIEARYYELASEWDKAIDKYHSLASVVKDEPNYALDLASVQTSGGKARDALVTLAELRKRPDMADDPRVDLREAFAAESLSDVKQQQAAAARAAQKATRQESRVLAAQAYWLECSALSGQGELKKAETACHQSINSAPFDLQVMARGQTVLANIMVAQGNTRDALEMRKQILENARKIGSQKDVVGALQDLGDLLDSQGHIEEARKNYEQALEVARTIGDKSGSIKVTNSLADHYYSLGDFAAAETLYDRSLNLAKEINDQTMIATASLDLGNLQSQLGHLDEAEKNIQLAMSLYKQMGMDTYLPAAMNMLGDVFVDRGDLDRARKIYTDSLTLSTKQRSVPAIAASRAELAALDLEDGSAIEAERLARQSAEEFASEGLIDNEADARTTLARALLTQEKLREARVETDRALALNPHDRTISLALSATNARLKGRSGDLAGARKDLDMCQADAVKMKLVGSQFEITLAKAEVLAESDPKRAISLLQTLEGDAKAEGYLRVAGDAERARKRLPRRSPRSG